MGLAKGLYSIGMVLPKGSGKTLDLAFQGQSRFPGALGNLPGQRTIFATIHVKICTETQATKIHLNYKSFLCDLQLEHAQLPCMQLTFAPGPVTNLVKVGALQRALSNQSLAQGLFH